MVIKQNEMLLDSQWIFMSLKVIVHQGTHSFYDHAI